MTNLIENITQGLPSIDEGSFRYFELEKKFKFTLNIIENGSQLPPHTHDQTVINCVVEGEFELTTHGHLQVFRKGQWLRIEKGMEHSVRALTEVTLLEMWEK